MVVILRQVPVVYQQVVVRVQLPELAVDDIEMFVGKIVGDLIDVRLLLQCSQGLEREGRSA